MDLSTQSIIHLLQQPPPPPPPSPPPLPPCEEMSTSNDNPTSSCGGLLTEEADETQSPPQPRQMRTHSAPSSSTIELQDSSSPSAPVPRNPRKRTYSTKSSEVLDLQVTFSTSSENSPPQKRQEPREPSPVVEEEKLLPLYIKLEDGTEIVNHDAYIQRGFGWVSADHPTRASWREHIKRGHDYENVKDFMDIIEKNNPGCRDPDFHIRERSRSRSRSPEVSRSPSRSRSPRSDSEDENTRYRSRSQTPLASPDPLYD